MNRPSRALFLFLLTLSLPYCAFAQTKLSSTAKSATAPKSSPLLLQTIQGELQRAMAALAKADPAPYYMSYGATDHRSLMIAASDGAILTAVPQHSRVAEITVRVASPALDNSHGENRPSAMMTALLPLEDDPPAIARILWQTTDREYKTAARTFLQVKTEKQVQAEE